VSEDYVDEKVLNSVDETRRSFVRKLILGTAFMAPAVASFSMASISGAEAHQAAGNMTTPMAGNMTTPVAGNMTVPMTGNMTTGKHPVHGVHTGNMTIPNSPRHEDRYFWRQYSDRRRVWR
jgi:hypothetical protein